MILGLIERYTDNLLESHRILLEHEKERPHDGHMVRGVVDDGAPCVSGEGHVDLCQPGELTKRVRVCVELMVLLQVHTFVQRCFRLTASVLYVGLITTSILCLHMCVINDAQRYTVRL